MDQITFPFMRLPTELQAGIVNHIGENFDLKSLCLVSKHVSDIATRCLYYEIEISHRISVGKISIKKKIKSLLINPAKLQFVRVITTDGDMNQKVSMLMDRLLPHLQKDSLKEINFDSCSFEEFPMPHQIEFLWHNQKNIQSLRLITYMVPWLDKFSKEEGQSAILKFFTDLDLIGDFNEVHQCTKSNMLWPLQNLDLTVLHSLRLSSRVIDSSIFSTVNALFAAGWFVNLAVLRFQSICNLSQPLILTGMPSLERLEVYNCDFPGPNLPLVLANDIRLKSLVCKTSYKVDKLIPLLTQAKGLEYLSWQCAPYSLAGGIDGDLIRAIMARKDTLRELWLLGKLVPLDENLEAMLWGVRLSKSRLTFAPGPSRATCPAYPYSTAVI
ncbi:hypothetical protein MMC31_002756 [Peltigera leucophlebia]|nr:hypothetical protein [Peltigera leucophlebia]